MAAAARALARPRRPRRAARRRRARLPIFLADAVDAAAPALVIPMPFVKRIDAGAGHIAVLPDPATTPRAVIVWLDAERLRHRLLEPLIAKYFGAGEASEYLVTDRRARASRRIVIYASSCQATVDERSADVSAGMFDLRMDEMTARGRHRDAAGGSASAPQRSRRGDDRPPFEHPGDAARVLMTGGANQGAWLLRARYRSGSLEAIVARSRRRNLAIGARRARPAGGAAFALVLAASQRQRRLARQQMEFVAVGVARAAHAARGDLLRRREPRRRRRRRRARRSRRYGSLIETEGRRLGDMVERVLRVCRHQLGHRPMRARRRRRRRGDRRRGARRRRRGARPRRHRSPCTPRRRCRRSLGDADALRSAVQNVVGNAVKYSPSAAARSRSPRRRLRDGTSCGFASPIAASASMPRTCRTSSSRSSAAAAPSTRRCAAAASASASCGTSIRSHGGDVARRQPRRRGHDRDDRPADRAVRRSGRRPRRPPAPGCERRERRAARAARRRRSRVCG